MLEMTRAEIEGVQGVVWIESDDMQELVAPAARTLAYNQRVKMGLANAGIESMETMPLDSEGEEMNDTNPEIAPKRWRRIFRLTPSPV